MCKYQSPLPVYDESNREWYQPQCEEPPYGTSPYCILHTEFPHERDAEFKTIKKDKNQIVQYKIAKGDFNFEGAKLSDVDLSFRSDIKDLDFRWAMIEGDVLLQRAKVEGNVRFEGAKIKRDVWFPFVKIEGLVLFGSYRIEGATIGGSVEFNLATVGGGALFPGVTIKDDVRFEGAKIGSVDLGGATIGGHARFRGVIIESYAEFKGATIGGDARFADAKIGDTADFREATIGGNATFEEAMIERDAWFKGATIGGDAQFKGAKIKGNAEFARATIKGDASFEGATIEGDVQFYGSENIGTLDFNGTNFSRLKAEENASRAAKQNCERRGAKGDADDYFYREMVATRRQKKEPIKSLELIVQYILGFGVYPLRLMLVWFVVATVFGLLSAAVSGNIAIAGVGFVTAFIPGYGISHAPPGVTEWVVGIESIITTFIWATFIVVFARKYMR